MNHRGIVACAVLQLDGAGVAALAAVEKRSKVVEQVCNDILVRQLSSNSAAVSQRATLRLGDQLLSVRAKHLRLSLSGLDSAVLEQGLSQVSQNVVLVLGGPSETGTLLRGRHVRTPRVRLCER